MKDRIIIVYQSKAKTGNTKHIAQQIAAQLKCEAVDIALNPKINLEQYNLVGFGSGIYF
jgi:flavodoxin